MSESLIQQYHMGDDGISLKTFSVKKKMTLFTKEAPANSVPAAAVREEEQVLFLVIRRKVPVDFLNC